VEAEKRVEWRLSALNHSGPRGHGPDADRKVGTSFVIPQVALLLVFFAVAGAACSAQAEYVVYGPEDLLSVKVPFQTVRLDNGLEIVLNEDHRAPVVAINLAYRVGQKDDPPGKSSLAHLYEHLMYSGSAHVPEGAFFRTIEKAGSLGFSQGKDWRCLA
jgi:hypothetical protein